MSPSGTSSIATTRSAHFSSARADWNGTAEIASANIDTINRFIESSFGPSSVSGRGHTRTKSLNCQESCPTNQNHFTQRMKWSGGPESWLFAIQSTWPATSLVSDVVDPTGVEPVTSVVKSGEVTVTSMGPHATRENKKIPQC